MKLLRYHLRYTSDLYILRKSDDWQSLICQSDYKIHIIDTKTNKIVWQSSPSIRYGNEGVTEGKQQ